jgi:hypothetical protein
MGNVQFRQLSWHSPSRAESLCISNHTTGNSALLKSPSTGIVPAGLASIGPADGEAATQEFSIDQQTMPT